MYACVEDQAAVVEVLLEHGANPLAKDMLHNEWNCLHFAIMQVKKELALFHIINLVKIKCVNVRFAFQDNVETVKALIEDAKKVSITVN